jgi:ATP-binding cassette subfamily F protein 1
MATYISEKKASIKLGAKTIIDESELIVNSGVRYGLVGPNGCGKSTVLNYIIEHLPEEVPAYKVDQHITFDSEDQTVLDFMLRANSTIYETNRRVTNLEQIPEEELTDQKLDELNDLYSTDAYSEYEKYVGESKKILKGLGITNYDVPVNTYSGGWRMRLAIAKALIIKPKVLVMDEPTNHLDLNAVIWLGRYLSTYNQTLIIVSHQIEFINQSTNIIWTIANPDFTVPKLYSVKSNYDRLQQTLSDIKKSAVTAYEKFEKEVEKQKKKSTPKTVVEKYIKENAVPRPPKPYEVKISFPEVRSIGNKKAIKFDKVSFGYPDAELLITESDFSIGMGDRYVIVGPNGVGKTTLFKLCMGELTPTSGDIIVDSRIRIGYYNQQVIETLPLELTPIQYLQSLDAELDIQQCRYLLGRIGLKKIDNADPCLIPIDKLSGGQKARVSFCAIQARSPHIILFDEPTNHLDIESIEGLIQGINEFDGGVIMITHDTHLISNVENYQLLQFKNKDVSIFPGGDIEDYIEEIVGDES